MRSPIRLHGRRPDRSRQTPRRREWGAALVEAALILPLLVTLIFAVVDFGFAFNNTIGLRQGTREAARQAAINTAPQPASGTWASNGCTTTPDYSTASPADGFDLMCYAKQRIGLGAANTRVSIFWVQADNYQANFTDPSPNYAVVVCTQTKLTSMTGVFSPILAGHVVTAKTEIRIEASSVNMAKLTPPYQETAFSSTGWPSSCTST